MSSEAGDTAIGTVTRPLVLEDHVVIEIVARNGHNAVWMSAEDYESLQEAFYLFSTRANAVCALPLSFLILRLCFTVPGWTAVLAVERPWDLAKGSARIAAPRSESVHLAASR